MTTTASSPKSTPDPLPQTLPEALDMVTELTAGLKKADQEIADLRQQLDWFKRNLFGRKSERRIIDLPQEGETLFDLNPQPEPECADENVELEEKVVKKKRRN